MPDIGQTRHSWIGRRRKSIGESNGGSPERISLWPGLNFFKIIFIVLGGFGFEFVVVFRVGEDEIVKNVWLKAVETICGRCHATERLRAVDLTDVHVFMAAEMTPGQNGR